ncbi:MAG: hypothetical protein WEB88_02035 [Gemmatimonadota bacterium]
MESPWPFPDAAFEEGPPDVVIRAVPAAGLQPTNDAWRVMGDAAWQDTADGGFLLRWRDLLLARTDPAGARLRVAPLAPAAPAALAGYLYAQLLSFSLVARGLEPYHATVVALPAGAVALTGPPGVGKSTLAAALLAAGGRLVTDDVLVLAPGSRMARAGPARLKLFPEAAELLLGLPSSASVLLHPDSAKRAYAVPRAVRTDVPLRAWVTLALPGDRGGPPERVRGGQAVRALLAATFNRVVTDPDRLRRQLAAAACAARIPVWHARPPRGLELLPGFAARVAALVEVPAER